MSSDSRCKFAGHRRTETNNAPSDASSLIPQERMKLKVRQHTYFRVHSVHLSMHRNRFQARSYFLSLAHVIFICVHDLAAAWGRSEGSENGALCSIRSH